MPEMIENRMVVDWQWPDIQEAAEDDKAEDYKNVAGYKEIKSGIFIPKEDAFDYALENCVKVVPQGFREIEWTQEFREMVEEWFFSGGGYREEKEGIGYAEKL